eukprot:6076401-Lingulodinium_polyedra.AAC.1
MPIRAMHVKRPPAAATARKPRASRAPCERHFWRSLGARAAAHDRFNRILVAFSDALHIGG